MRSGDSPWCVVVDNGSGMLKTGFAGEIMPRAFLPAHRNGESSLMQHGVVQDWDLMEKHWDYAFTHQLRVDTEQCNLLVSSSVFDTKDHRERLMQILFETFAVPSAYVSASAVFELYAVGRENGVVLGCGAQSTYAVLVHEGLPDMRTLLRSCIAGDALTEWTMRLLQDSTGISLDLSSAAQAKEALGLIRVHSESLAEGHPQRIFKLPDGREITADTHTRVAITEPLFQPSILGVVGGGLAQLVAGCIRSRDRDGALHSNEHGKDGTSNWYRSIVLAGGSTGFPLFKERLSLDLTQVAPSGCTSTIFSTPEHVHAAWLGASILGSLSTMGSMWVTKQDYDDNGPLIVHRKCL